MDIIVTDMSEVDSILDYVHDRYFDLGAIKYDEEARVFNIPLSVISEEVTNEQFFVLWRKWKNPIYDAQLTIPNTLGFNIKDDAEIGEADINTIYLNKENLVIECGIPVKILLKISGLKLILHISDKIVGHRKRFAFGRG